MGASASVLDEPAGHDPVLVKVSAVSLGGGGTRAEVADGDMGTISIEVTSVADGVSLTCLRVKRLLYLVRRSCLLLLICVVVLRIRMRISLRYL